MKISIIICTKDRLDDLLNCVNSILRQTFSPFELILVDASTDDSTREYFNEISKRMTFKCVYIKQKDDGLSRARNIGVKKARGMIILFLDDDVVLDEKYLEKVIDTYLKDKKGKIGGVQGFMANTKKMPFVVKLWSYLFFLNSPKKGAVLSSGHNTYPEVVSDCNLRVNWLSGSNMSYRREVFKRYHFDENLGAAPGREYCSIGEDMDFSYKVAKKYVLILNPKAKVIHKPSSARANSTTFFRSNLIANRYFFKNTIQGNFFQGFFFWWSQIGLFLDAFVALMWTKIRKFNGNKKLKS